MLFDPNWKPVKIKLEPWQEVLLKAADILEEKGWCQNTFGSYQFGMCAVGAITAAVYGATRIPADQSVTPAFRHAVHRMSMTIGYHTIPQWNDAVGRTKEEVVAKLREVANAV